jgi:CRP-like cAMP-binding protein
VLFHEDDPGDAFHFLVDGHVAIQMVAITGVVVTLTMLHAPDNFGEQALLEPSGRRTATVQAIAPTTTLALHRDAFMSLCREHPAVNTLLVSVLAAQVRRLSRQLVESLHVPAEQRVLRRLQDLATGFAGPSMAGTTRPTANRALQLARDRGAVELARRRIEIRDLAVLADLAGAEHVATS